jgi:hypothetical protein
LIITDSGPLISYAGRGLLAGGGPKKQWKIGDRAQFEMSIRGKAQTINKLLRPKNLLR